MISGVQAATVVSGAATEIFANADTASQIFDRWSGDVGLLLAPGERQSGAQSPIAAASVTAIYRSRPTVAYTSITVRGMPGSATAVTARYSFSRALPTAGVVFRFHGSGGSARGVTTGTEDEKFNRDLVADGYAVVALDSNDRVTAQWENLTADPAANQDTINVRSVMATLSGLGLVNSDTRYFAVGHSNGGAFAPLVAQQLGWRAAYVSCARGNQPALQQVTVVPTIWSIAQNDTTIGADGNAGALANYQTLVGRGIRAEFITFVPSAVYPSRFTQIEGIAITDSQAIYTSLKTTAPLDSRDFQTTAPTTATLQRGVPAAYSSYSTEIGNLLRVSYSEHEFSAAASARVRAFFARS